MWSIWIWRDSKKEPVCGERSYPWGPTGSLGWEVPLSYVFWSLQTGEGVLLAGGCPDFFSVSLSLDPVSLLFSTPLSVLPSIFLSPSVSAIHLSLSLCCSLSLSQGSLLPYRSVSLSLAVSPCLWLASSPPLFFYVSWPLCAGHRFLSCYSEELRGMRETSFELWIPPIVGTSSSS